VGSCALVSAAFTACSSDDSANPAAIDGVDSSMQVPPPGPDDTETEGGGRDSTVEDAPGGDSTIADGPAEAKGADGGVQEGAADAADGGPDAADGHDGGPDAADDGPDTGPLDAGADGSQTSVGAIYAIRGDTCGQCAIDNCSGANSGIPACETTTGVSVSGSPDPGMARSTLCFSTLTCVLQANCFQNDSVSGCYCGTIDAGSCSTTHANGPCKTQVEDGYESTDLNVILGTPGNTDTGSDVADQIVECLYFDCNTECSFADAGP
jgi:hypothetical protein